MTRPWKPRYWPTIEGRAPRWFCFLSTVGVRAWPHAVISSLGARARGGVVRLRRSVSHIVGHGHLSTSGWVPLGPVRARRGSSGTRMGPYLSRTPIRVRRVFRQGSSSPVGTHRPHRPKFGQVQEHQIWSEKWGENRRFGPKQRPNEPNRLSGPIRTTPEAKNSKNIFFLRKTAPGGPRPPPSLLSAQAGAYV